MRYLKKFESFKINEGIPGGMGTPIRSKPTTQEEASDKPDEFLCQALVNPIYSKYGKYNSKLVEAKINVAEEKKGFFNKIFGDNTTMEFHLESELLEKPIQMLFKLKKDKFVLAKDSGDNKFIYGFVDEPHQDKFIKYLLTQSKWSNQFKEAMPDIDKKFTKESFK